MIAEEKMWRYLESRRDDNDEIVPRTTQHTHTHTDFYEDNRNKNSTFTKKTNATQLYNIEKRATAAVEEEEFFFKIYWHCLPKDFLHSFDIQQHIMKVQFVSELV